MPYAPIRLARLPALLVIELSSSVATAGGVARQPAQERLRARPVETLDLALLVGRIHIHGREAELGVQREHRGADRLTAELQAVIDPQPLRHAAQRRPVSGNRIPSHSAARTSAVDGRREIAHPMIARERASMNIVDHGATGRFARGGTTSTPRRLWWPCHTSLR